MTRKNHWPPKLDKSARQGSRFVDVPLLETGSRQPAMLSAEPTGQPRARARKGGQGMKGAHLVVRDDVLEEVAQHDWHVRRHRAQQTLLAIASALGRKMAREEMQVRDLAVRMSGSGVALEPDQFLDVDGLMQAEARLGDAVVRVSVLAPGPPRRGGA